MTIFTINPNAIQTLRQADTSGDGFCCRLVVKAERRGQTTDAVVSVTQWLGDECAYVVMQADEARALAAELLASADVIDAALAPPTAKTKRTGAAA